MKTLEDRIEELKDLGVRWGLVESLFKKLPRKLFFPKGSNTALEKMIIELTKGELKKDILILEANYKIKLNPHIYESPDGDIYSKYETRLHKLHRLACFPGERDDVLEVKVNIFKDTITFDYVIDGEPKPKPKTYHHDDFCYYGSLSEKKFLSSKGIVVKEIGPLGIMGFGGRKHNFGRENTNTYAIVFFDKGEIHAFDLEGNMLLPALSSEEAVERIRLLKAYGIGEDMTNFDPKEYLEMLMSRNRSEWKKDHERFSDIGRNYIIEGEMQRKTNHKGLVDMILYDGEQRTLSINAGSQYAHKDVVLDFKGENILVNLNGELINGRRFKSAVRYTVLSGDVRGVKILAVKTISTRGGVRTTAGPFNYSLSRMPLLKKHGSLDNFSHIGVMAYVDPANADNNIFEMLLMKKDGSFVSERTYATSARVYRKELNPSS